jgi:hypothetical protein
MPSTLAPIERKRVVDEPSICPNFDIVEFAEIMCVELQEIR